MLEIMNMRVLKTIIGLCVLWGCTVACGDNFVEPTRKTLPSGFRPFNTTHYTIFTDCDLHTSLVARIRLECNYRGFRRLAVKLYRPMPGRCNVYLFSNSVDYFSAGGIPNTSGCYIWTRIGNRNPKVWLMAWQNTDVFEVMQHEGFHQFAMNAFPALPLWLNEGLAEYFHYSKWTGDELLEGFIPGQQFAVVKVALLKNAFVPMEQFLEITNQQWLDALQTGTSLNYYQAWSIVQFFMHADDGKYRNNFENFLCQLARGTKPKQAWKSCFSQDIKTIEGEYKKWWLTQAKETRELNSVACTRIFISFIGRNFAKGYTPKNFKDFIQDAEDGRLGLTTGDDKENYLPNSLMVWALANYSKVGKYTVGLNADKKPFVRVDLPESGTFIYTFRPRSVGVNVIEERIQKSQPTPAAPATSPAENHTTEK